MAIRFLEKSSSMDSLKSSISVIIGAMRVLTQELGSKVRELSNLSTPEDEEYLSTVSYLF